VNSGVVRKNFGALMIIVASTPRLTEFQQREGLQAIEMCKYYVFITKGDIVKALHAKTAIAQFKTVHLGLLEIGIRQKLMIRNWESVIEDH
jgi:sensor histidine kinase regulating citrate/malate metabolism